MICNSDTCIAQETRQVEELIPLDSTDSPQMLHNRNFLRMTDSIQFSSKERLCSVKFSLRETINTVCTEGLKVSENTTFYFKPDYKPAWRQSRFTFVCSHNIRLETEQEDMDNFLKEQFNIKSILSSTKYWRYLLPHLYWSVPLKKNH